MNGFSFRLRAKISSERSLDENMKKTLIENEDGFSFELVSDGKVFDNEIISIYAHGFQNIETAKKIALKLKLSLLSLFLNSNIGIKIEPNEIDLTEDEVINDMYKKNGNTITNDCGGICIYKTEHNLSFISLNIDIKLNSNINTLSYKISELYRKINYNLSDNEKLALELYSSIYFEPSIKSKYILLVTIIECLSEARKYSTDIKNMLKEFSQIMNKYFSDDNFLKDNSEKERIKNSLKDRINELSRESISKACQRYIKETLGENKVDKFIEIYKIRSFLVHAGTVPLSESDIRNKVNEIQKLNSSFSILNEYVLDILKRKVLKNENTM